jgi:quinolinate synthase
MADMANISKVERARREIAQVLDPDSTSDPGHHINSAAGPEGVLRRARRHRVHVANAREILQWSFARRGKCCSSPTSTWGGGPAT